MDDQTSGSTTPGKDSVWTQPRFILAAVVVVVILVMGGVLAFAGPGSGNDSPPSSEAKPMAASSTSARTSSNSICGLPAGDQAVPLTPPTAEWELVKAFAVPTAPKVIGPGRVSDVGLRSCFAQSPVGALYAAVNFIAATGDHVTRRAAVEHLVAAGESRDDALQEISREGDQRSPEQPQPRVQLAGFTFLYYDANGTAVVDLAMRGHNGKYARMPLSLRWEDGDWKVVVPPSGDPGDSVQAIRDLTGYVAWGGA